MKIMFLMALLFLSSAHCFAQLELPRAKENDIIITNLDGRYTFKYLPEHRLAQWVAYKLTKNDIQGDARRSDTFRSDSLVISQGLPYATTGMYKNSGYDRGHLVASADRLNTQKANRATFLMSNITPQRAALNRGTWKTLEEKIREWTNQYDTLYIVCGPIIENSTDKIANKITVPTKFYKAILLGSNPNNERRCYIMPNDTILTKDYNHYLVPLDSLEKAANIDLIWINPHK